MELPFDEVEVFLGNEIEVELHVPGVHLQVFGFSCFLFLLVPISNFLHVASVLGGFPQVQPQILGFLGLC
jgi:hypothetical protein